MLALDENIGLVLFVFFFCFFSELAHESTLRTSTTELTGFQPKCEWAGSTTYDSDQSLRAAPKTLLKRLRFASAGAGTGSAAWAASAACV